MRALAIKSFLCVAALMMLSCAGGADEGMPADVVVGNVAPTFALTSLDGATVKSSTLNGTPVVINFWATWCQVCRSEIPELKKLAADSNVKVVGIALDQDGADAVRAFVKEHDITYQVLMGDEQVFQRFNGAGIPYTLILDSSNRIVKIHRGVATAEELRNDLREIGPRT